MKATRYTYSFRLTHDTIANHVSEYMYNSVIAYYEQALEEGREWAIANGRDTNMNWMTEDASYELDTIMTKAEKPSDQWLKGIKGNTILETSIDDEFEKAYARYLVDEGNESLEEARARRIAEIKAMDDPDWDDEDDLEDLSVFTDEKGDMYYKGVFIPESCREKVIDKIVDTYTNQFIGILADAYSR